MTGDLRHLRTIRGNLAKLVKDKTLLREELKDMFQGFLSRGQRKFHDKLNSEAVSEHFSNTVASRRLSRSFNTKLSDALKIDGKGSVTFSYGIKSSGRSGHDDPSEYYSAIDDAGTRRRGPSIQRVIEWMKERGIVQKLKSGKGFRKTITTKKGTKASIKSVAFLIQRAIWRKNASRAYKSLKLSAMFADIIDIKNPKSDFRQTMLGRVSNLVLVKTA